MSKFSNNSNKNFNRFENFVKSPSFKINNNVFINNTDNSIIDEPVEKVEEVEEVNNIVEEIEKVEEINIVEEVNVVDTPLIPNDNNDMFISFKAPKVERIDSFYHTDKDIQMTDNPMRDLRPWPRTVASHSDTTKLFEPKMKKVVELAIERFIRPNRNI